MISSPYLCSTHHSLAPHLLFLHKLNITSADCTGTEMREKVQYTNVECKLGMIKDYTDAA